MPGLKLNHVGKQSPWLFHFSVEYDYPSVPLLISTVLPLDFRWMYVMDWSLHFTRSRWCNYLFMPSLNPNVNPDSKGQYGAHLGRHDPGGGGGCWPHELCYLGIFVSKIGRWWLSAKYRRNSAIRQIRMRRHDQTQFDEPNVTCTLLQIINFIAFLSVFIITNTQIWST